VGNLSGKLVRCQRGAFQERAYFPWERAPPERPAPARAAGGPGRRPETPGFPVARCAILALRCYPRVPGSANRPYEGLALPGPVTVRSGGSPRIPL